MGTTRSGERIFVGNSEERERERDASWEIYT
jgi:hypothetical protein